VWVHGDVTGTNLLVREGRLAAVLDFGCSAFGDPASDLTIAWTFLSDDSRARFKQLAPVEASAWARGRGWALWKALEHVAADRADPGEGRRRDRRVGWRFSARDVVAEVIDDHRRRSPWADGPREVP
jgi:aminoglycoside phosphotransferase (APT) family kinase protein